VNSASLWPFFVYLAAAIILVAGMLVLSWLLGGRHRAPAKGEPYESGILATGTARVRFDAKFYLVAMFFVVFDLEAAFVFAWAVALRPAGWTGYVDMVIFIAVLVAALVYVWREGALDWGIARWRRIPPTVKREQVPHALVADQTDGSGARP
jgi:NADH-quinone oxidoreductase subunit A